MKKAKHVAGLAIRAALVYFTAAGVCQNIQAQTEIRFQLVHNTLIVVSMMAGDQGPFDFVLDTGADTTIVDPAIAAKVLTGPGTRVRQTTLSSIQTVTTGSISKLSVGAAEVENVGVLVQDLGELRKLDPKIEGIAGQNFLSHFNYLIDYKGHIVRIEQDHEIRDMIGGEQVSIETGANRMIVDSEAQSGSRAKLRLLLDSGANAMVLLPSASEKIMLPTHGSGVETTSSGTASLGLGRLHSLTVGSEQFHDIAVAVPSNEPAEQIGDGLLPTSLFKSLYVNNHEGFVMFNPRVRKN